MDNKESLATKRVCIFLAVAFGMSFIIGLLMAYGYTKGKNLYWAGYVMQCVPTMGLIVAILLTRKKQAMPETFFISFGSASIAIIAVSVYGLFFEQAPRLLFNMQFLIFCSLAVGATIIAQENKLAKAYGLKGGKWKPAIYIIPIFFAYYIISLLISFAWAGKLDAFTELLKASDLYIGLVGLLPLFFLSFMSYLGEEWGWRFYLQPFLQKRLGKRKGVLLLGLIWGIWHLPLCIFYYAEPSGFVSAVLNQLIGCVFVGTFFAYAYMKTENVWLLTFLHFLNNNLSTSFNVDFSMIYGEEQFFLSVIVCFVFTTILLLLPTFRRDGRLVPTLEERLEEYSRSEL